MFVGGLAASGACLSLEVRFLCLQYSVTHLMVTFEISDVTAYMVAQRKILTKMYDRSVRALSMLA